MSVVNAPGEALAEMNAREAQFDIEALFRTHYRRVARMIARVVRDPARAEELAVEVFLKLWRNSSPPGHHVEGWLYRVALRAGLDELRRESRRARYARLLSLAHSTPRPALPNSCTRLPNSRKRVRSVLNALPQRQAEFLVLRSHGFSYDELALTLSINPSSVGTLLSRAQQSFRKESSNALDRNNSTPLSAWVEERLACLAPGDNWEPDVALARLKQLHGSRSWLARRWPWAVATAAAVCLALMVSPSPRVLAHRCLECSVAVWQSLAASGPPQAELKRDSARALAPDFTLRDATGKEVRLSSLRGKVVLLNFWATWCHGCQVEIPWFIEFESRYENRGLVVVGVSVDSDGWTSVRPWVKEKKVNYAIVLSNDNLAKQYGLDGMPLTVLIDREGKIADRHSGIINRAGTEQKLGVLLAQQSF